MASSGCGGRGSILNYPSTPNHSSPAVSCHSPSYPCPGAKPGSFPGGTELCGVLRRSLISPGLCPHAELLVSRHREGISSCQEPVLKDKAMLDPPEILFGLLWPPSPPHVYPICLHLHFSGVFKYHPTHQLGPICRAVVWLIFISLFLSVSASPIGEANVLWPDRIGGKRNIGAPGSAAGPVPSSRPSTGER